jgi:hypothetical protein
MAKIIIAGWLSNPDRMMNFSRKTNRPHTAPAMPSGLVNSRLIDE